ncbi:MAG: Crp/Fnr family transcriptional regulator [Ignavibacteria bacterium]|nr:Crp/Fnr family transcriptional regulator [Ignavibacteria bacterium]
MIDNDLLSGLQSTYPFLKNLSASETDNILNYSIHKKIPAGEHIFTKGDSCTFFALMLSGKVRVYKAGETGREITLYRFGKGESCILTASCILSRNSFPAAAVTEEETEAILVPRELFREYIKQYDTWRNYFFDVLSERLSEVMEIVNEIAFRKMDARIAEYLAGASIDSKVNATHQQIAAELGTSREVVSRILSDFERGQLVKLDRGKIMIINSLGLAGKTK